MDIYYAICLVYAVGGREAVVNTIMTAYILQKRGIPFKYIDDGMREAFNRR